MTGRTKPAPGRKVRPNRVKQTDLPPPGREAPLDCVTQTSGLRPLPTREQILEFIRESPTPVGKREIARAFHISGDRRVALKKLLADIADSGAVDKGRRRRMAPPKALPAVAVIEIAGIDDQGDLVCRPIDWREDSAPPKITLRSGKSGITDLAPGNRALVQLKRIAPDAYEARPIRKLEAGPTRVLGLFERTPQGGRLRSLDKRNRADLTVLTQHEGGAEPGEIVVAEVLPSTRMGLRQAQIVERLGDGSAPGAISLIAIHSRDLPTEFSAAALAEAEAATVPTLAGREDLRDIPLVTIDGADARDFDDAVWAEADPEPANPGGWHMIVAIADVAHYVPPASALDRNAYARGNSVYFPDRVVPMLPERLSNGLCSLNPAEPRACLAFHLWIDSKGELVRHRLVRGVMRSAARLTYEQVQAAADGAPDDPGAQSAPYLRDANKRPLAVGPLLDPVIRPLYGAYGSLIKARAARGTLELDLPERKVIIGEDGKVKAITARTRLDSHRLIEEFMIAANVAAAETLETRKQPGLYRVHDRPDPVKLEAVRTFIQGLGQGLSLTKGQVITPAQLTRLLLQARELPEAQLISDIVLRAQAQAIYSPDNIGHFGLALRRYAHFTSPIRRYADLIVHRALIATMKLGKDGLDEQTAARLAEIGAHISMTERRAAEAEREAVDRFTASYLSERVGATFSGRISGVARFGLFIRLDETGADGIVPISTLPGDFYIHEEAHHRLVGRRTGRVYRLADRVMVKLIEANGMTGSTVFQLIDDSEGDKPGHRLQSRPGSRGGAKHPRSGRRK